MKSRSVCRRNRRGLFSVASRKDQLLCSRFRRLRLEPLEDRRLLNAAPPLLVDLQASSDSGLYNDDNLTNISTPTIDITAAQADDVIRVYCDDVLLGEAIQVAGTSYQYAFASGELAEGDNSITARSFDGVEESGDSPPLVITLDTTGPRITASTPAAPVNLRAETLDAVSVTFSEPIDLDSGGGTFTVEDASMGGPEGAITPTSIASLGGDQYEIAFAAQTRRGTYTVSIGPDVADLAGNLMDQDQDVACGEAEDDVYTFTFDAFDADTVFDTPIKIAAGNTTYDGQDICVRGVMLTMDGYHAFNSVHLLESAIVTHTAASVEAMDLAVLEALIIDDSSALSADGKGYGAHTGPGAGGWIEYWRSASGGGYGGTGGNGRGPLGGVAYGSFTEPTDLGSGGGGWGGGAGGGAIRLVVGGTLTVDGVLTAHGRSGWGGGSGGSIYVTAAGVAGGGLIGANGGNSGCAGPPSFGPLGGRACCR